jgi:hypothetical protein
MEVVGGIKRESSASECIERNSSNHVSFGISFIELVGIIDAVIHCNILLSEIKRFHVGRNHVSNNNETRLGMNLVYSIVEGISLIDSMENWSSHMAVIIIVESNFEVVVAVGSNDDVFSVEMRIED